MPFINRCSGGGGIKDIEVGTHDRLIKKVLLGTALSSISKGSRDFCQVGNDIYVLSSTVNNYTDAVFEKLDINFETISALETIPTSRSRIDPVNVGDYIYVIGGQSGGNSSYRSKANECYSISTNTWVSKTSMGTATFLHGNVLTDNSIYVIGGVTGANSYTNRNECYDIATDTWSTKTSMTSLTIYDFLLFHISNSIYCFGGTRSTSGYTVRCYDIATDTWSTKVDLGKIVYTSQLLDGLVYLGNSSYGITIYDPTTDTYTEKFSVSGYKYVPVGLSFLVGNKIRYIDGYNADTGTWVAEYSPNYYVGKVKIDGKEYEIETV